MISLIPTRVAKVANLSFVKISPIDEFDKFSRPSSAECEKGMRSSEGFPPAYVLVAVVGELRSARLVCRVKIRRPEPNQHMKTVSRK